MHNFRKLHCIICKNFTSAHCALIVQVHICDHCSNIRPTSCSGGGLGSRFTLKEHYFEKGCQCLGWNLSKRQKDVILTVVLYSSFEIRLDQGEHVQHRVVIVHEAGNGEAVNQTFLRRMVAECIV